MTGQTPMSAPRNDVTRAVPFEVTKFTDIATGYRFEGYSMMWDKPTRINSWEGEFDEQIKRSAPRKSIRERTPVMQFDHGRHPMFGSIPIGNFVEIREDEAGLFTVGELHRDPMWGPLHEALRSGSIKGMSFRFDVIKERWGTGPDGIATRDLVEIRISEMGPVVFPAYSETTAAIRDRAEVYLRDLSVGGIVTPAEEPVDESEDSRDHSDASGSPAAPIETDHPDIEQADPSENLLVTARPGAEAGGPPEDDGPSSERTAESTAAAERRQLAEVFDALDKRFIPLI